MAYLMTDVGAYALFGRVAASPPDDVRGSNQWENWVHFDSASNCKLESVSLRSLKGKELIHVLSVKE